MNSARLPTAVVASVGLHVGALCLFIYFHNLTVKNQPQIVSNVDLLIQTPQSPSAVPVKAAPVQPSTWNFLKLALPPMPSALPQAMNVNLPQAPKPLMAEAPKLEDRGRRADDNEGLKALDLSRARAEAAQSINENLSFNHNDAALAQMPRLEDVGERQVANLPQAIKLDDERRQAQAMQVLGEDENLGDHAQAQEAPAALEDAAPATASPARGLSALLPSEESLSLAQPERPAQAPSLNALALPSSNGKPAILPASKKAVDIEGPMARRKVLHYEMPAFPDWAKQEGILEADVAIRFWVSPDGTVQPDMSVVRTSGYGRLDRLAMNFLARWRFAPIDTDERQWGIITFRFVLE